MLLKVQRWARIRRSLVFRMVGRFLGAPKNRLTVRVGVASGSVVVRETRKPGSGSDEKSTNWDWPSRRILPCS